MKAQLEDKTAFMSLGADGKSKDPSNAVKLVANQLTYQFPKSFSVARSRCLIRSDFNSTSYTPSQIASVYLNAGSSYVDGKESYLVMTVTNIDSSGTLDVGSGSFANIFSRAVWTTSSGTEVERTEQLNTYIQWYLQYQASADWIASNGSAMGYGATALAKTSGAITVTIPMSLLFGCCDTNVLLPPQLVSGARLDFAFESGQNAFLWEVGGVTFAYTITAMSIMLQSVQLDDAAAVAVQQASARDGLDFIFSARENSRYTHTGENATTFEARKALSQAEFARLVVRESTKTAGNATAAALDSFESASDVISAYQYRLGSLYYPLQPLSNAPEMYQNALICESRCRDFGCPPNVTYAQFIVGKGEYVANLERSTHISGSGVPIAAGRSLQVSATFANATAYVADLHIQCKRAVRCYLDRCVVRD